MTDMHKIAQESKASQDKWELEQLLLELEDLDPQYILEIGVHLGGGMRHLKEAFNPKLILGLEQDTCYPYPDIEVLTGVSSHDESTKQEVMKRFGIQHLPMAGQFDLEIATAMLPIQGKIDAIFIDGDHSYAGVQLDFYMYKELVRPGGVIAFHDARLDDNDTCEVFKFWNDIKHRYTYKEFFSPEGTGTGVGVLFL